MTMPTTPRPPGTATRAPPRPPPPPPPAPRVSMTSGFETRFQRMRCVVPGDGAAHPPHLSRWTAMPRWLEIVLIGAALWMASWGVMVLLARRLPPGLLRDAAEFLPACVTTARTLRGDPAVPRRAKVSLMIAVVWVISPIDLLPEFLPVIGPLDDVVAVVLLLRYAARSIPREALLAAWPAEPRLLLRLLGKSAQPQA